MSDPSAAAASEPVSEVAKLRDQATRCRRLSKSVTDREMAATLARLAVQFEERAAALEQAARGA